MVPWPASIPNAFLRARPSPAAVSAAGEGLLLGALGKAYARYELFLG
jgi:hypothetical protein